MVSVLEQLLTLGGSAGGDEAGVRHSTPRNDLHTFAALDLRNAAPIHTNYGPNPSYSLEHQILGVAAGMRTIGSNLVPGNAN